jgi:hypothetical protein
LTKREGKEGRKFIKKVIFEGESDQADLFHPERLREYEFNKLKYYYGVVVCDTVQTATALYEECDGQEIEATALHLDVRFIPDDADFTGREILNKCNKIPTDYQPKQGIYAKQIQSTESDLTWDKDLNPMMY